MLQIFAQLSVITLDQQRNCLEFKIDYWFVDFLYEKVVLIIFNESFIKSLKLFVPFYVASRCCWIKHFIRQLESQRGSRLESFPAATALFKTNDFSNILCG